MLRSFWHLVPLIALLLASVLVLDAQAKSSKAPPAWRGKIAAGSFLFEEKEPKNFELMASGIIFTYLKSEKIG